MIALTAKAMKAIARNVSKQVHQTISLNL